MSHTRYEPRVTRVQRSELAVPGSNPGMFEKAASSTADYVFLDLEDAVAPDDKEQARRNVIEALNDIDWRGRGENRLGADQRHRHPLHVPRRGGRHRASRPQARHHPHSEGRGEQRRLHGRRHGVANRAGEENRALDRARSVDRNRSRYGQCRKHRHRQCAHGGVAFRGRRLRGQLSGEKPSTSAGSTPTIRATSGMTGCRECLSPAAHTGCVPSMARLAISTTPDGYRLAARRGAALGYEGKWAIHPSQIDLANDVFSPPDAEVTRAKRDH